VDRQVHVATGQVTLAACAKWHSADRASARAAEEPPFRAAWSRIRLPLSQIRPNGTRGECHLADAGETT